MSRLRRSLLLVLALLAAVAPTSAADCRPAAAGFAAAFAPAMTLLDEVGAHRIDWPHVVITSETQRTAYERVRQALVGLLRAADTLIAAGRAANAAKALCDMGQALAPEELEALDEATTAARALVPLAQAYLDTVAALPSV